MNKLFILFTVGALAVSFSGCKDDPAGTYNKDEFWVRATDMSLKDESVALVLGGTETAAKKKLEAIFTPADTFNKNIVWESSNESAVTIDTAGEVTAVGIGTATITATAQDNASLVSTCAVTVALVAGAVPVESLTVPATLEVEAGKKAAITATVLPADATGKDLVWKSADDKVASVSADGEVTGVKAGTVKITAVTKYNERTAECTVTVKAASADPEPGEGEEEGDGEAEEDAE